MDYSGFMNTPTNGAVIVDGTTNGHTNGNVNGDAKPGLKILIAGAGIGGLTTAIALRQQGHNVEVRYINMEGGISY